MWIWPSVIKYFTSASFSWTKLHIVITTHALSVPVYKVTNTRANLCILIPYNCFTTPNLKNISSSIKYFIGVKFRSPQKANSTHKQLILHLLRHRRSVLHKLSSLLRDLDGVSSGIQKLEKLPNWNWSIPPWEFNAITNELPRCKT